ncbi:MULTISPECIES: flagellar biosynthesis protein FlhF [Brevibacillus]|uniref:flagellar biosynthesis protein FlhF n=1 Tax=Brevibacillus TaxID=55080 RepID=UPI00156B409D|nr:flagellar biosynthesis protein FlhF [Brevibacillus sp. RS1.1]NRR01094.1 flagellar biosynthesis protein FlhF [Brevibacillus sp. RS1.1]
MRVKRYIVDSMPEAMEKIRTDLGMDAVILNSKPIKTGGLFGMFGKQRIEVIAAVDEKASERENSTVAAEHRTNNVLPKSQTGTYTAAQAYRRPTVTKTSENQQAESTGREQVVVAMTQTAVATLPQEEITDTRAMPKQGEPTEQHAPDTTSQERALPASNHDAIATEMRDMRQMFQKLLVHDLSEQLPPAVQSIRAQLLKQEVTEELTAEIIRKIMEKSQPGEKWTEEEAFTVCRTIITSMIEPYTASSPRLGKNVRYAFFFGPTGVGKTTTIAKLAANSMLKEKRKIGFITADTYRMAAVEQLKTYANILNVPLEVVFSPREMAAAMERLSDCDLIFVDTAGRNFRNDEYVEGIRELLEHGKDSVNYLVLSLSSKFNDMKAIVQNFAEVQVKQVIFTKADETSSFGTMLNVCQEMNLQLSYVTTGQNVPDDIVVATPELVSTMIMGE